MDPFVHLHCHTDNSILDGHSTIEALAEEAARLGQPALAITDHGNPGGALKHFEACNAVGVKPIVGCEFYVAPQSRTLKEPVYWGRPEQRSVDVGNVGSHCHITVVATSDEGVRNLFRLHATANTDGFYRKPRIDLDSLAEHNSGLVVTTGCAGGLVATRIKLEQYDKARELTATLRDILGDRLYIEIMHHDNPIDAVINPHLIKIAKELDIPLVATNDSHYTTEGDAYSHDALLCIQTRQRLNGVRSFKFEGTGYHLRSHREMEALFREIPDAISSTLDIAERVEPYREVFTTTPRFPKFNQSDYPTNDEALWDRVFRFVDGRDWADRDEARRQATYELETICGLGFTDYLLVLQEMTDYARSRKIRVGPGRGSAGGSLVAYALGITDLNPLQHGLLFERFLNPSRVSNPDVDLDIQDNRRDEVIEWAVKKYGHDYFAQIGTVGKIGAKNALKDAARVLGKNYYLGEQMTYRLPAAKFGRQPSLKEGNFSDCTDEEKEVLELARTLEGRIRNQGVHSAGVVISPEPLPDLLPLYKPGGKGKSWVTSYDMTDVEKLGLVKYDWLGLKNLTVIDDTMKSIERLKLPWEIPVLSTDPKDLDDTKTYELLSGGHTLGVFQLDSSGMQQLLRSIKPNQFGDVSAVLALYRPGPISANAHVSYAKRKNGRERISYPHSELDKPLKDVLGETYGLVVYQEQVLEILRICCGYTYATAEGIFNAMRKKDTAKMLAAKPDFVSRMLANGYSQGCVDALWGVLVPFSDYSFNKSHTTGYGAVSYWTGYLKANFPTDYWAAVLSCLTDPKKLVPYIEEADRMQLPILPPDINTSEVSWTPTDDGIRYGLKSIKGFGDKSFDVLMKARPFKTLDDFFRRANKNLLNKKTLSALIQSGALDGLCPHRTDLYLQSDALAERALNDRKLGNAGAMSLLGSKNTYFVRGTGVPDNKLIQRWEQELLGTVLSRPPVEMTTSRWLEESEFLYIHELVSQYPGRQALTLKLGYATIPVGFVNFTEKLKTQLLAIGGVKVKD